ncbi:MAG: glycosyltransferase family 1 protein, partial [Anaerolineae bacterium]
MATGKTRRIGFVSTRLAGTDGVSLEATKWVDILSRLGHECFALAGEVDWSAERAHVVPQAHFRHPEVRRLSDELFGIDARSPETSERVQRLKELLKGHLYRFIRVFRLELLIVENALAIPMNVPLGLALTEVIAESGIPAIGHHHDFVWERQRFWPNAAGDYLRSAFPPTSSSVRHVVINSIARAELARRTGASATLVPNVMDFGSPDAGGDHSAQARADGVRATLGIEPDET